MRVEATFEEIELENDNDKLVDGVEVECTRCQHTVRVFGTSGRSVKRGLVMLREECPYKEENYYYLSSGME